MTSATVYLTRPPQDEVPLYTEADIERRLVQLLFSENPDMVSAAREQLPIALRDVIAGYVIANGDIRTLSWEQGPGPDYVSFHLFPTFYIETLDGANWFYNFSDPGYIREDLLELCKQVYGQLSIVPPSILVTTFGLSCRVCVLGVGLISVTDRFE